ncbi:hypothetical protein R3P38DRAFT_2951969 [Favolaschia claudopus]|uniref:BTB domain-containing protein n=1 Tax=Favolaschia claudopus TaxID=2862362 RepID=A0AAW0BED5_9AGAR
MSPSDTDPIDAQSPADTTSSAPRHQDYYFQTVIFKVEDRLFNVPRYHFERASEVFAGMFSLPQPSTSTEGQSDLNPIVLDGKYSADFQALLKVLYPLDVELILNEPHKWMTTDEWISVLKLSTEWCMARFRRLAITKLDQRDLSSCQRIMLARQYHIVTWLRRGYSELVERAETISEDEAEILGWKTTCRLFQARERAPNARCLSDARAPYSDRNGSPPPATDSVYCIVWTIFAEEFASAEY